MASRRLNERLSKYNYLYDDDDVAAKQVSDMKMDNNGLSNVTDGDKLPNGSLTINNNHPATDSTSERVNSSRKFSPPSVSVSSTVSSPSTHSYSSSGTPRGPLLSSITSASPAAARGIHANGTVGTSSPSPSKEFQLSRNVSAHRTSVAVVQIFMYTYTLF